MDVEYLSLSCIEAEVLFIKLIPYTWKNANTIVILLLDPLFFSLPGICRFYQYEVVFLIKYAVYKCQKNTL